jgi:hypothetical protein
MKKDGIAISISFQSIFATFSIIDKPTNINIGAIAAIGTHDTIGAKNNDNPKHIYYCWEVGDKYFEDGPYELTLEELVKTTKFKDIKDAINDFIINL